MCAAAGVELESYRTFGPAVVEQRGSSPARMTAPPPAVVEKPAQAVPVIPNPPLRSEPRTEPREVRTRAVPAVASRLPARGPAIRKLHGMAFCSASGGAGATTVTATVARILAKRSESVAIADNHPLPSVAYQFGASFVARGTWSLLPQRRGSAGAVHIFSRPEIVESHFGWLKEDLQSFQHPWDRMLVNGRWEGLEELATHDLGGFTALIVMGPNPAALMRVPLILEQLTAGNRKAFILLNRFDRSKAFHEELESEMRARHGGNVLPFTIRESDSVAEASLDGVAVTEHAPESEVAMDYLRLADWVQARSIQGEN